VATSVITTAPIEYHAGWSRGIVDEDPGLYTEYWGRGEVVVGFGQDDAR
jgi:hypothetical protein